MSTCGFVVNRPDVSAAAAIIVKITFLYYITTSIPGSWHKTGWRSPGGYYPLSRSRVTKIAQKTSHGVGELLHIGYDQSIVMLHVGTYLVNVNMWICSFVC